MTVEVWFRNPKDYARELAEVGHTLIAWDRGMLIKRTIDPVVHAELFFGNRWRQRLIGGQGTMEIDPEHGPLSPLAVYPTWSYGQPSALLEDLMANPVGQDQDACFDLDVPVDERPVWGQKHVVVVAEGPEGGASTNMGRKFYRWLAELQQDYPECELMVHGLYTFRFMFGLGFAAVDYDPRTDAQKGKVVLANGSIVPYERAQQNPKWLSAVGMSFKDIEVPRNRCIFNIRTALWAGENYDKVHNFKIDRTGHKVDAITPKIELKPDGTKHYLTNLRKRKQEGDYIACDSCSLRTQCKYEREGAVCSVPNSEGSKLARYFRTRDSQMIVDGLSEIVAMGATRVEAAMEDEEFTGLDPQVTSMLNSLFSQGVQLAKLIDPTLRSSPKVAVQVNGATSVGIEQGNQKAIIAGVVRQFELEGIPRDKITPEMIEGALAGAAHQQRAIQGQTIDE
jgi:hypothetical protein